MLDFLFWLFFVGILVASLQDLKRREVDNWLNYGLLAFGIIFVVYNSLFNSNLNYLINGFILVAIAFVLHYLFYFGRVFAGGDAKLLLGMSPFFASSFLYDDICIS